MKQVSHRIIEYTEFKGPVGIMSPAPGPSSGRCQDETKLTLFPKYQGVFGDSFQIKTELWAIQDSNINLKKDNDKECKR